MTRVVSQESIDVQGQMDAELKVVGRSKSLKRNDSKRKKRLEPAGRFRGEEGAVSPSKNLTDAPVVPPIGQSDGFRRNVSSLSIELEQTIVHTPRTGSRGRGGSRTPVVELQRSTSNVSIRVEDIRLNRKHATEYGFPKPVDSVVIEKQKTVHFDKFVRVRYVYCLVL